MTLLEAISPMAVALLNQPISGGGIVNFQIVKNSKTGRHVVHSTSSALVHALSTGGSTGLTPGSRPICGGGNSARSAQWQTTMEEPNCRRCAEILQRKLRIKKDEL